MTELGTLSGRHNLTLTWRRESCLSSSKAWAVGGAIWELMDRDSGVACLY